MEHYAFQAQLTRVSPVGLVPGGLRIDLGFAGTMTAGPWAGHAIEGTDYLLIRPDGVGVIDARELVSGQQGPAGSVHAEGYVVPPMAMPPLPELLDPSFRWPDAELPLHGSARVCTGDSGAAAANHTVFAFTGSVNMSQGSLAVSARAVPAAAAGGDPATSPDAALLARGYQAFAAGDIPSVLALFSAGIDWHIPGSSAIAGHYHGHEAVAGFFTTLMERSGGTFRLEVGHIAAAGDQVIALVTEHAQAGSASLAARAVHVWRMRDGLATEFRDYCDDQAALDAFWGAPAAVAG